jgi:hypothetical protein
MSSESHRRRALSALVVLVLAAAGGCGKKGDPSPAPRTIPAAIADLSVRQRGFEVVLEMMHPKTTAAGLPLPGLDEVVLYELQRPAPVTASPAVPPPGTADATAAAQPISLPDRREFEGAAKPFLRIAGAELASAISGDRITLRFRLPEPVPTSPPQRFYAVRAHAEGGETSDLSNLVALLPRAVPAAPAEFQVQPQKSGVALSWTASSDPAVVGYNVYRRAAELTGYGAPIATPGAGAAAATDASATYGQRYIFAVTAVASREPLVESALSIEREIAYEDRFGPAAPKGITALPMPGELILVWEPVAEPDVAGYVVERADPGSGFHRVTPEPVAETQFDDAGLGSGFTFRYRVAAIDRSGNLGEFSREAQARIP